MQQAACETGLESGAAAPGGAAGGRLRVEWLPSAQRAQAESLWRRLETRLASQRVMSSWDWTDCWLNCFGATIAHRFAVAVKDGEPIGIALLCRSAAKREGPFALRTWHLGTAGEEDADSVCVEYNHLLCPPAARDEFFVGIWRQLQAENDWDELQLDGFAAGESPAWPLPPTAVRTERKVTRYVDLERVRRSGAELVTQFGDSTRKILRQNLRFFAGCTCEWAETPEHAREIFEDLMRLHQERWTAAGSPGVYASRLFTNFHRALLERLAPRQRMILFRVAHGGATLGCSQLLVDDQRALVYQGGWRMLGNKHSPGLVTDYLCMQACLERGLRAFDYMAGDSIHKQRLTTDVAELTWSTYRRPRTRFVVLERLRQLKRAVDALRKA